MLARSPGYTTVALLSLAVAFALNFWFFGFIHQILIRPVTADGSDARVVGLYSTDGERESLTQPFTWPEFELLRAARVDGLEALAGYTFSITGIGDGPRLARGFAVLATADYFRVMGAAPRAGRFFTDEETSPSAQSAVAVVSDIWWKRQGAPRDMVGSRIHVGGVLCEVIGIAPEGFAGLSASFGPDVWLPIGMVSRIRAEGAPRDRDDLALSSSKTRRISVVARFDGEISVTEAKLRVDRAVTGPGGSAADGLALAAGRLPRMSISTGAPGEEGLATFAAVVIGLGLVVFAAACINLANLSLARATARLREFAIRRSLGAGRLRLLGQLLVEGSVLVLIASLAGLWISNLAADGMERTLARLTPAGINVLPFVHPGFGGLAFGASLAIVATLSLSLIPGLRLGSQRLGRLSRSGDDGAGAWHEGVFLRSALVVGQIASAIVLLTVAMRLHDSARLSQSVPAGFETEGRYAAEVDLGIAAKPGESLNERTRALLDSVQAAPGVEAAALSSLIPLSNITYISDVRIAPETRTEDDGANRSYSAIRYEVSSGYFDALGIPVVEGRDFDEEETFRDERGTVAIINKVLAERVFGEADASVIGRELIIGQQDGDGTRHRARIIGLAGNTRHDGLASRARSQIYLPYGHNSVTPVHVHAHFSASRVARDSDAPVARDLVRAIQRAVPGAPVVVAAPLATLVDRDIGAFGMRTGALLATVLALLALALTLVGVYGVKAYAVQRRTREIGIRIALGATPRAILGLLLRQTILQLAVGVAIGSTLAALAERPLSVILLEATGGPAGDIAGAALLTALAAGLATWLPIRSGLKVQPAQVLRSE